MNTRTTTDDPDSNRKVINQHEKQPLKGTEAFPITVTYALSVMVGLGTLLAVVWISLTKALLGFSSYIIAFAIVAVFFLIGWGIPEGESPIPWLKNGAKFYTSKPRKRSVHGETDDERTQTITDISGFHSSEGVFERPDGTLFTVIQVRGADLSPMTASTDRRRARSDEFAAAILKLDRDEVIEFFSAARTVQPTQFKAQYDESIQHPNIKRNPGIKAVVQSYREDIPKQLRGKSTAIRGYYAVVQASTSDVREETDGVLANIGSLHWTIKGLTDIIHGALTEAYTDDEIREKQLNLIKRRRSAAINALTSIEGCTASELDIEEIANVIEEFWTGHRTHYTGDRFAQHGLPIVVGERRPNQDDIPDGLSATGHPPGGAVAATRNGHGNDASDNGDNQ